MRVAILVLLVATQAQAATAYFTGRSKIVTTATYQQAWRCEYRYNGSTFWELFPMTETCPMSVEVE